MREPKIVRKPDGTVLVQRFSPIRRAEHLLIITTFVVLVVTGFPQKFHSAGLSRWLFDAMGGLDKVRTVHRIAGLVFAAHATLHIAALMAGLVTRRMRWNMLPTPQDIRDAWQTLQYYLGFRKRSPELPKFDYRQKFEYLGMVLGGLVMVASGLILLYPIQASGFLPGQAIPAALVAHSNEAMLALLVLVVWHVYGSHLSPEVFPGDTSIFTGYLTLEELRERHGREFRRLFPDLAEEEDQREAEEAEGEAEAPPPDEPAATDDGTGPTPST